MNNKTDKRDWTVVLYNELLQYRGEWVLYSDELQKIIAHHNSLATAKKRAIEILKNEDFTFLYVKPEWGKKYCLPIYFKTVDIHPWKPFFDIEIGKTTKKFLKSKMLVDSGADISVISKEFGEELGLKLADNEKIFSANGVGGGILEYVEREIYFRFNKEHTLKVPVAWIQDARYSEMIIGREVVFDSFDITLIQANEVIIFKKHEPTMPYSSSL